MRQQRSVSARIAARLLPAAVAVSAIGFLGTSSASAQYVFTNWDGNQLWSNPGNWNQPTPPPAGEIAWINFTPDAAIINYDAGAPGELVIGQGGGDGAVHMTSGGSISVPHINLAWGSGRNGSWTQDGGTATVAGELRAGRDVGGGTATIDISGGIFQSGPMFLGYGNAATNMTITGGAVSSSGAIRLSDADNASTAMSTLSITGGTLDTIGLLSVGVRTGGSGTGRGSVIIGGDAVVNIGGNVAMRPGSGNSFSIVGSDAAINVNRPAGPGITGFEVHRDNDVNFIFDEEGISTVDIAALMRWSDASSTLNVDASALTGTGTFDLFTFDGYYDNGITSFGTENLTFAEGYTGEVLYNPNSIQLAVSLIPEPASLGLLGIGGLALLRRRGA